VYKQGQAGVTKASVSIVFNNADKASSPVGYEQHDQVTVTRQVRPRAPVRAGPAVGRLRAAARCSEAALAAASVLACCCSSPPRCARGLPVCRPSLGLGPHRHPEGPLRFRGPHAPWPARQLVIGGRNKYLINGHVAQPRCMAQGPAAPEALQPLCTPRARRARGGAVGLCVRTRAVYVRACNLPIGECCAAKRGVHHPREQVLRRGAAGVPPPAAACLLAAQADGRSHPAALPDPLRLRARAVTRAAPRAQPRAEPVPLGAAQRQQPAFPHHAGPHHQGARPRRRAARPVPAAAPVQPQGRAAAAAAARGRGRNMALAAVRGPGSAAAAAAGAAGGALTQARARGGAGAEHEAAGDPGHAGGGGRHADVRDEEGRRAAHAGEEAGQGGGDKRGAGHRVRVRCPTLAPAAQPARAR